ncbi:MAG: response regulator [bacterium]
MSKRILAVDDEIHMLKLLRQVIQDKTPHRVSTTNNSLEIPELLSRQHYSLIIADLRMPGLSGMDLLKWIKDNNRTEVVIVLTAFGSPDVAHEALRAGAFDYLTKPIHREELLVAIERALLYRDRQKELDQMQMTFHNQSLAEARELFEEHYFTRVATISNWDADSVARHAGISVPAAREFLRRLQDKG